MSVSTDDVTEWWRTNGKVVDTIPQLSDAITALNSITYCRPMPSDLPMMEKGQTEIALPPIVPNSDEDNLVNSIKNFGVKKISTEVELLDWWNNVEKKMCDVYGSKSKQMLITLESEKEHAQNILEAADSAIVALNSLNEEYVSVRQKTCALHNACETLLQEQTRLTDNAEAIHEKLSYFQELDSIKSRLKNPELEVNSEQFLALLAKIDSCIEYMSNNAQFKDSGPFLIKFNNCLTQVLGQIKTYVMRELESSTNNLLAKRPTQSAYSEKAGTLSDDAFTLYYGSFKSNAPKIKALVSLIEQRSANADQYVQALTDIYTCYCYQREQLIGPGVYSSFNDLKDGRDVCGLVRASCAFMFHVSQDEYQLFRHFFNNETGIIDDMLQRLCQGLYDLLRPYIISIYHLETLSELCSILKLEMLDDHIRSNHNELKAFEIIVKQMLEDVQERLVYRTNIYIKTDIMGYAPSGGDLAYPDKLIMMEDIAKLINTTEKSASDMVEVSLGPPELPESRKMTSTTSPADLHGMWYPTVRRVLVCLSKLYRCIDRGIFQGLSQEALGNCIESLESASEKISNQKTKIDGQLFLVKHLLILREQIAPFHTDFSIRETKVDFKKTKTAVNKLMHAENLSRLFQVSSENSLLEFILDGSPEIREYLVDSKKGVDKKLKTSCETFIHSQTQYVTGRIKDYIVRANAIIEMHKKDTSQVKPLSEHKFATPETIRELCIESYKELKSRSQATQKSMRLYLANKDTEFILFKPIRMNIQAYYSQLQLILWENYSADERLIINAPTPEQVALQLCSKQTS